MDPDSVEVLTGQEEEPVPKERQPTIKSVQRAGKILSAFTVSNPRLSLNQLTESLGSTKATAHRYTMALREANLVRYSERDTLFSLGPQILTLSSVARAGMPIIAAATPLIHELVQELNQTVVLSVWDGGTAVVVHVDDSADRVIQVSVRTGSRLELEQSAQGQIFCAFLDPTIEPFVKAALATSQEFRNRIDDIRTKHIAINSIALTGVRSVAVPIMKSEKIVAAMAVIGTAVSVPEQPDSTVAKRLTEVAGLLMDDLKKLPYV